MFAITNYHKLDGLKQQKLFSHNSTSQKSKLSISGLKSKCWHGHITSLDSREEFIPYLFYLLMAANIHWFVATLCQSSRLASSNLFLLHLHKSCFLLYVYVKFKFLSASFLGCMWYHLGTTWIIQDNLPIAMFLT